MWWAFANVLQSTPIGRCNREDSGRRGFAHFRHTTVASCGRYNRQESRNRWFPDRLPRRRCKRQSGRCFCILPPRRPTDGLFEMPLFQPKRLRPPHNRHKHLFDLLCQQTPLHPNKCDIQALFLNRIVLQSSLQPTLQSPFCDPRRMQLDVFLPYL